MKLFETHLGLITAFLDHHPCEPGHGRAARRRAGSQPTQLVRHHLCPRCPRLPHRTQTGLLFVLILKAQHAARGRDTKKPPPRYYGSPDMPDVQCNVATLRSTEPRGRVSDARRHSKQPKGPLHIGNASITARTPRPPNGPTGSPAQARAVSGGRTRWARASPRHPPPRAPPQGGGGAALVGCPGLRALTLAHRSHGTMTRQDLPGRDRVYQERLHLNSSGREGSGYSATTTTQADNGRVATTEGLSTPSAAETCSCGLDAWTS